MRQGDVGSGMDLPKAGKYAAIAVAAFVALLVVFAVLSFVFSVVMFVLELFVSLLMLVVALLVLLGLGYAVLKGLLWLMSDDGSSTGGTATRGTTTNRGTNRSRERTTSRRTTDADPVDQLTERYVEGELSEEEFERRLEFELDNGGRDELDRELERS